MTETHGRGKRKEEVHVGERVTCTDEERGMSATDAIINRIVGGP